MILTLAAPRTSLRGDFLVFAIADCLKVILSDRMRWDIDEDRFIAVMCVGRALYDNLMYCD